MTGRNLKKDDPVPKVRRPKGRVELVRGGDSLCRTVEEDVTNLRTFACLDDPASEATERLKVAANGTAGTCQPGSLAAGARDVMIFNFRGLLDRIAGQVVRVPDDAFACHLGVFAQELERIGAGGGIVFLVGKFG